mmetsp:Transcript_16825/g.57485  ORF Transcript_16825/g.57485 Transcript_16825/m.57485 type:complete len:260 (-) Transcript_16825:2205-2984(-)
MSGNCSSSALTSIFPPVKSPGIAGFGGLQCSSSNQRTSNLRLWNPSSVRVCSQVGPGYATEVNGMLTVERIWSSPSLSASYTVMVIGGAAHQKGSPLVVFSAPSSPPASSSSASLSGCAVSKGCAGRCISPSSAGWISSSDTLRPYKAAFLICIISPMFKSLFPLRSCNSLPISGIWFGANVCSVSNWIASFSCVSAGLAGPFNCRVSYSRIIAENVAPSSSVHIGIMISSSSSAYQPGAVVFAITWVWVTTRPHLTTA